MTRHLSDYQLFKLALAEQMSLSTNILHYVLGLALALAAIWSFRKHGHLWPFVTALALASIFGIGMEIIDRRDDLLGLGIWNWRHSVEDFGRTVVFPALALALSCLKTLIPRRSRHKS